MKVEICIDNVESLITANQFPIHRIELCSSLSVGGITPNYGFVKQAVTYSKIPIAMMIRPRAGDFLYNQHEINIMLEDIKLAKQFGVPSIVIGVLNKYRDLDITLLKDLIQAAEGMEITFHRAFDLCREPFETLEQLIELGCHRILTSGQAKTAFDGIPLLSKLVKQANNRIQIMAGCGISAENVKMIIEKTHVPEIHFSAKGQLESVMKLNTSISLGHSQQQDFLLDIADSQKIKSILQQIKPYYPIKI